MVLLVHAQSFNSKFKNRRMHSSRMRTARSLTILGRCLTWGGDWPRGCLTRGIVCLTRGVYHVTYPIMHLISPVCCLHTNWDTSTVHLLTYCCLVMWPARHAWITPLHPWTDTHLYKHNLCKLRLRVVKIGKTRLSGKIAFCVTLSVILGSQLTPWTHFSSFQVDLSLVSWKATEHIYW